MTATMTDAAVALTEVEKVYGTGPGRVVALAGVTIAFERGSFIAVMGPSGSGKSTFLHCAAGLDAPTSGSVVLDGLELAGLDEDSLTRLRRDRVGFVFQSMNLLPALTVEQNIGLPMRLAGGRPNRVLVEEIAGRVGLANRLTHRPSELSGGQQQRVAIARALVTSPAVIFADEPTGSLDTRSAAEVLALLSEAARDGEQSIIMVTHDPVAASHADRCYFMADGDFVGELANPTAEAVAERMTNLGAWANTTHKRDARDTG
jgi:putative ABC transport system ATP-binding protein